MVSGYYGKSRCVLHVTGMHSFKFGGFEQFMTTLAGELKAHGYKLVLMYNSYPRSEEYIKNLSDSGAEIFVSKAINPVRFFIDFFKIFLKFRPVIVHSHFQPVFPTFYAKLFGIKNRFVTLHMMITDENFREVTNTEGLRLVTRMHIRAINIFTTKFFAVSDSLMRQYQLLYPGIRSKLELFYLGVAPNPYVRKDSRTKLGFVERYIYIACVAFSSPMKGIDILIEAAGILRLNLGISNFKICLIGLDEEDQYTLQMKEMASQKKIMDHIIWFNIINNVPEVLPAADIYCQPSRTEALPLAIGEAGMAGLPVVASRVGGIPELVRDGETGLLFESGNAEQLASQLKHLALDEDLRHHMGEQSKKLMMNEFNLINQAREMCNKYIPAK
jgi:glycosyltransferase involved in cell wall biosynthesis